MVFNATFNKVILWRSILLVEEIRENHWAIATHWQILYQVHLASRLGKNVQSNLQL